MLGVTVSRFFGGIISSNGVGLSEGIYIFLRGRGNFLEVQTLKDIAFIDKKCKFTKVNSSIVPDGIDPT